jgi:hypothetical protein
MTLKSKKLIFNEKTPEKGVQVIVKARAKADLEVEVAIKGIKNKFIF